MNNFRPTELDSRFRVKEVQRVLTHLLPLSHYLSHVFLYRKSTSNRWPDHLQAVFCGILFVSAWAFTPPLLKFTAPKGDQHEPTVFSLTVYRLLLSFTVGITMFCVFELFAAYSGFTGVLIVVAHLFSNKVMSTLRHFGNLSGCSALMAWGTETSWYTFELCN